LAKIKWRHLTWPVAGSFRIAHGSLTEIDAVHVTINDGQHRGRAECRPYARYGETPQSVQEQIAGVARELESHGHNKLNGLLPAGAARNALDCAFWDLKAKKAGKRIWGLLGLPSPRARITAFTLSIDTPHEMAKAARAARAHPVLKLKIDGIGGLESCFTVMKARPDTQLIVDANEALTPAELVGFRDALVGWPVLTIEQPVRADEFDQIENEPDILPNICADESAHTTKDLQKLWNAGYRAVNIKLDKCGGLSEALEMMRTAKQMGFVIMAGCMVGSSLAMAPMMVLESYADIIDLDGPLLLKKDIGHALRYEGAIIHPPKKALWG
jgi:L-alanine-DL-glutamate epimerase-like enolase superfamily enzyme